MQVFRLADAEQFDRKRHVEKILGTIGAGDVAVACWEPGQISPYHCHPFATEIYFCYQGGGKMSTPDGSVDIAPGTFVVHPEGELHEYANGPERTLLFRVRYGSDMVARHLYWRGRPDWTQRPEDREYFSKAPTV
jgi:quercetin dioxygenase-like cupin family protein